MQCLKARDRLEYVTLNAFFFFFFFFFLSKQTCQIWVRHSFEIWNFILDEQDTRHNTELKKSVVQTVFIVSVISFLVYFDKQVYKKLEKSKQKNPKKNLYFAESNAHQKTNARGSFET